MEVFRFPWPGPGNSEGPVSPEPWNNVGVSDRGPGMEGRREGEDLESALVVTSSWPGPGDSEG